jgi:phage-related protein
MDNKPILTVVFYRQSSGKEPVREWLSNDKLISRLDKKSIGEDIKTVQYGWPLGMPLVRKIEPDLWEIRSMISHGIARIFFSVQDKYLVLLHGFIKKADKISQDDLSLARERLRTLKGEK